MSNTKNTAEKPDGAEKSKSGEDIVTVEILTRIRTDRAGMKGAPEGSRNVGRPIYIEAGDEIEIERSEAENLESIGAGVIIEGSKSKKAAAAKAKAAK
jgi:hypothetical protein